MRLKIADLMISAAMPAALLFIQARAANMHDIHLDIGKNIQTTASESGTSSFKKESHWGLEFYELINLRPDVTVHFARKGYEIAATPLFSVMMTADSENNNDMAVESIELQYRYKPSSHEEAKRFVETILLQFRSGKWRRYISASNPAVTGRSAYLDEAGNIASLASPDPDYHMSIDDWRKVMSMPQRYTWIGDGVKATLSVDFNVDSRGLTYNINLEFVDFSIENARNEAAQARELIEGDQKGWKSTERFKKDKQANHAKIKILEANAIVRGDRIVPRD